MRVGDIIKQLRKERKITQAEFAKKLGVAPTAVSAWERNENRPLMDKLSIIADLFEVPVSRFFESEEFGGSVITEMTRLPVVETLSFNGEELLFGEISGHESTPQEWIMGGEHFYIRAKDDSMNGARIFSGDLLLIKKQSEIENGDIAAILMNNEVTLKRVYINGEQLILQSENPKFSPIITTLQEISIVGRLKKIVINL